MDYSNFSLSDEGHRQEEKAFVEALFLKILKKNDKEKYRLVMNAYVYKEEHHTRVDNQIDAKIELLLPHAVYLVEKLWDKLIADHSKEYVYTLSQLSARMSGKSCLATEFHPDFVDNENRVHFLVDQTSRGAVMLCLELMGHDSTDVCKERATLKKEYDRIFVSNETQREEMLAYVKPYSNGKVYSFYAKFRGNVTPTFTSGGNIKELNQKCKEMQDELIKCKKQIDEYREQIREYEDEASAFRHDKMNNDFLIGCRTFLSRIKKGRDVAKNVEELEKKMDTMFTYVAEYAKNGKVEEFPLWKTTVDFFGDMEGIEMVIDNQCPNDCLVKIKKNMFVDRVLGNIKQNILLHAFPENHGIENPRIKISLRQIPSLCILTIANNGLPFKGDLTKVLEKGVSYGNSTGEGMYLAARCVREYHKGCDIIPYIPDDEYSFAVELRITNQ